MLLHNYTCLSTPDTDMLELVATTATINNSFQDYHKPFLV